MTLPEPPRTITTNDLAGIWPGAAVVDVRSREEHSTAFIPGSLNIPLEELPARLTDLPNTTLYAPPPENQTKPPPHGTLSDLVEWIRRRLTGHS